MMRQYDIDLAKGRIQVAFHRQKAAEDNLKMGNFRDALHSAYYAAYTAIRVLLNLEYEEQKNHGGNIGNFRRYYIKTQLLDLKLSSYIGELYKFRDIGDYDLDFIPDADMVASLVAQAKEFVDGVHHYLNKKYQIT